MEITTISNMIAMAWDCLFPRFCVSCAQEGSLLCDVCTQSASFEIPAPACPFCRKPGSLRTCEACRAQVFLDGLSAAVAYRDPRARAILHQCKYQGDVEAMRALEEILSAHVSLPGARTSSVVCPIPLHPRKLRSRGFNQADLVAERVAEANGLRLASLLKRTRHTRSRAATAHTDRLVGDLDECFQAIDHIPETVIVCDDVFTSGSTMDAAAKALKEAGARTVWGFVFAKS